MIIAHPYPTTRHRRPVPAVLLPSPELKVATIRELIIELAQAEYQMRRDVTTAEASVLQQREQDVVDELRRRDLNLNCHQTVTAPQH